MLNILALAAAVAQSSAVAPAPAAPAAVTARALKDLPGTTIIHYDVAGKNGPAVQKSLQKMLTDPAQKDVVRLISWDVGTKITKATTGTTCTIQGAKTTLTSNVRLPRLTAAAKLPGEVMTNWTNYVAMIEGEAAANLWFLSDRLRAAEQSLVGKPCDQAGPAWDAQLASAKTELAAFVAQRQLASKTKTPVAKPVERNDELDRGGDKDR